MPSPKTGIYSNRFVMTVYPRTHLSPLRRIPKCSCHHHQKYYDPKYPGVHEDIVTAIVKSSKHTSTQSEKETCHVHVNISVNQPWFTSYNTFNTVKCQIHIWFVVHTKYHTSDYKSHKTYHKYTTETIQIV